MTSVSIFRVSIFHLRTNLEKYLVMNLREKRIKATTRHPDDETSLQGNVGSETRS